jgi:hypothetical protein
MSITKASSTFNRPRMTGLMRIAPIVCILTGCDGAPSRNILGSYFPSWMVCALIGIALALAARVLFHATGLIEDIPLPFVVTLAIACACTFAVWLLWLS